MTFRICDKCPIPHYENCPDCFGYGLYPVRGGLIPVSAFKAQDKTYPANWQPCPTCGSGPGGLPPYVYEKAAGDLLDMIRGVGKHQFIGPGVTSYPVGDENNQKIHGLCLDLEQRGLIYRHDENDKAIVWMPTKADNPQDLADALQRQAQAETTRKELTKVLFNRTGLDRLRGITDSEWSATQERDE